MITNYKIFKENILKPTTSKEDKLQKEKTYNKQLLIQKEVIELDEDLIFKLSELEIDETWDFDLDPKLIKTKKIIGDVLLKLNHIPNWLKNIEIDGDFDCNDCKLTSLENCPKIIRQSFYCNNNSITDLENAPNYVGKNFWILNNSIKFTKENIKEYVMVKNDIINE